MTLGIGWRGSLNDYDTNNNVVWYFWPVISLFIGDDIWELRLDFLALEIVWWGERVLSEDDYTD